MPLPVLAAADTVAHAHRRLLLALPDVRHRHLVRGAQVLGEAAVKHYYKLIGVFYNPFQGRKYQFECEVCGLRYNIPTDRFWGRIW